jgi:hypothetical protein
MHGAPSDLHQTCAGPRRPGAEAEAMSAATRTAAALLAVLACSGTPSATDFHVGATRDEILGSFGPPARKESLRKTGDAIWGPIETFWSRVPAGDRVEIWAYPVKGGTVELYFLEGSERVQGTGFAPEGAVFEAGAPAPR